MSEEGERPYRVCVRCPTTGRQSIREIRIVNVWEKHKKIIGHDNIFLKSDFIG